MYEADADMLAAGFVYADACLVVSKMVIGWNIKFFL